MSWWGPKYPKNHLPTKIGNCLFLLNKTVTFKQNSSPGWMPDILYLNSLRIVLNIETVCCT